MHPCYHPPGIVAAAPAFCGLLQTRLAQVGDQLAGRALLAAINDARGDATSQLFAHALRSASRQAGCVRTNHHPTHCVSPSDQPATAARSRPVRRADRARARVHVVALQTVGALPPLSNRHERDVLRCAADMALIPAARYSGADDRGRGSIRDFGSLVISCCAFGKECCGMVRLAM